MKYIEQSWQLYLYIVISEGAGEVQISKTRKAFFCGAAVLFESIMMGLDPGEEETERDMQRLKDIRDELDEFGQQLDSEYLQQHREKMN